MLILFSIVTLFSCSETFPQIVTDLPDHDEDGLVDIRFDYIVVGGGGAGCIVARTLSDEGYETLLIERGGIATSKDRKAMPTLLLSRELQALVTSSGMRSHAAALLGGGTALNYGAWIEEDADYYVKMQELSGLGNKLHPFRDLLKPSEVWVRKMMTIPSTSQTSPNEMDAFLSNYTKRFHDVMNETYGQFSNVQPGIQIDRFWNPINLMNANSNGERVSTADVALASTSHLTILLESVVLSVNFAGQNEAQCVIFRSASEVDYMPLGSVTKTSDHSLGRDGRFWNKYLRTTLRPSVLEEPVQDDRSRRFPYRVCLKSSPHSEIILAAGAIHSPLIAMRSGVGPKSEIDKLQGVKITSRQEGIGQGLQDRPMLPLSFWLNGWTPKPSEQGFLRTAGLKKVGTNYSALEEILGGRVLQASFIATRLFFPVEARSGWLAEVGAFLLKRCALEGKDEVAQAGVDLSDDALQSFVNSACSLFSTYARCFKHSVAWIPFLAQIHSRGSVTLDPTMPESPIIDPGYFQDERDLQSMVRSLNETLLVRILAVLSMTSPPDVLKGFPSFGGIVRIFEEGLVSSSTLRIGVLGLHISARYDGAST